MNDAQVLDLLINIQVEGQAVLAEISQRLQAMGISLNSTDAAMKNTSASANSMDAALSPVAALLENISAAATGTTAAIESSTGTMVAGFLDVITAADSMDASLIEITSLTESMARMMKTGAGESAAAFESIVPAITSIEEKFGELASSAAGADDGISYLTKSMAEDMASLEAAVNRTTMAIARGFDSMNAAAGSSGKTMGTTATEGKGMMDSLAGVGDAADTAAGGLVAAGDAARGAAAGFLELAGAAGDAAKSVGDLAIAAGGSALESVGGAAGFIAGKVKDLAETAGLATIAFAGLSTKLAGDFQASMNKVQFQTNASAGEMKNYTNAAIDIGKTTTFSSKQAAEGLATLTQMHYSNTDAININKAAANAAMIYNIDYGKSINTITGEMKSFGIPASDVNKSVDQLVTATRLGKQNFADFSTELSRVGANAHAAGMDFAGTTANLLALTDQNITAKQAAQELNAVITSLEKPNKVAQGAIKSLGLSIYDGKGNMRDMSDIVGQLTQKTAGMTMEQKNLTLGMIFGRQNMGAVNDLLNAQVDGYDRGAPSLKRYEDLIRSSDGATKKAADTLASGLNYQIKQLKGSIEEAMISIGQGFLPGLSKLATGATGIVNKFIDWEQANHKIRNSIQNDMTAAIKAASPVFIEVAKNAFDSAVAFEQWGVKTGTFKVAFDLVSIALKTGSELIHALASDVAPIISQFSQWEGKTHTLHLAIEQTGGAIQTIAGAIKPLVSDVVLAVEKFASWATQNELLQTGANILAGIIASVESKIKLVATAVMPVIESFMKWENRTHTLQKVLDDIGGALQTVATGMAPILSKIGEMVQKFLEWETHTHALQTAANLLVTVLNQLFGVFNTIVSALAPIVSNFIAWEQRTHTLNSVIQDLGRAVNTVITAISPIAAKVADLVQKFLEWETKTKALQTVAETLGGVLKVLGQGVINLVTAVAPVIGQFIQLIQHSQILQPILYLLGVAVNVIGAAIQVALVPTQAFIWLLDQAAINIGKVISIIEGTFRDAINHFIDALNQLISVADVFLDKIGQHIGKIDQLKSSSEEAAGASKNLSTALSTVGQEAMQYGSAMDQAGQSTSKFTDDSISAINQWVTNVDSALTAATTTYQNHGMTHAEAYGDALKNYTPDLQQIAAELARNGVVGTDGIIPEYKRSGIQGAKEYIGGIELQHLAAGNAGLQHAINVVLGLEKPMGQFGITGRDSAIAYIQKIAAANGIAFDAGGTVSQSTLNGLAPVVAGAGSIGAQAAAAFANAFASGVSAAVAAVQAKQEGLTKMATLFGNTVSKVAKDNPVKPTYSTDYSSGGNSPIPSSGGGGGGGKGKKGGKGGKTTDPIEAMAKKAEAMGKVADLVGKMHEYYSVSSQQLDTFFADMQSLITRFDQQAAKFTEGMDKSIGDYGDAVSKAADSMSKVFSVLNGLKNYSTPGLNSMDQFNSDMDYIIHKFYDGSKGFNTNMLGAVVMFAEAADKVGAGMSSMLGGLEKARGYASVGTSAMDALNYDTQYIVGKFADAGKNFGPGMLGMATLFSATADKVGSAVKNVADGLKAASGYTSIGRTAMDALNVDVQYITGKFSDAGKNFGDKGLATADLFSATMDKVGSAIKNMAAGLNLVRDWSAIGRTAEDAFNVDTQYIIEKFSDAGKNFGTQTLAASDLFSKSIDIAGGAIAKVAAGLNTIRDWQRVGGDAIREFVGDTRWMVEEFALAATAMGQSTLDHSTSYADAISKAGDAIGKAAAGLKTIKNWQKIGGDTIREFVGDTRWMVEEFGLAAAAMGQATLDHATAYADACTKVVGAVSAGAAALTKLKSYSRVGYESIATFTQDLGVTMNLFKDEGAKYTQTMLDQAGNYAKTASSVVDTVSKGSDAFSKLQTYAKVPAENLTNFFSDVQSAMQQAGAVADKLGPDILALAKSFGDNLKSAFDTMDSAVKTFQGLQTFSPIPTQTLKLFADNIREAAQQAGDVADKLGPEMLTKLQDFGTKLKPAFDILKTATEVFKGLEAYKSIPAQVIGDLVASMRTAIQAMAQLSDDITPEIRGKAETISDACSKIFSALDTAVKFFDGLAKIKDNPAGNLQLLIGGMETALQRASDLDTQAGTLLEKSIEYATKMGQAASNFATGAAGGGPTTGGAGTNTGVGSGKTGAGSGSGSGTGSGGTGSGTGGKSGARAAMGGMAAMSGNSGPAGVAGIAAAAAATVPNATKAAAAGTVAVASMSAATVTANTSILDMITKAVDISQKMIAAVEAINTTATLVQSKLDQFMSQMNVLVQRMVVEGKNFGTAALTAATQYGDAISKVADPIVKAVAGLNALNDYILIDQVKIWLLGQNLRELVGNLGFAFKEGGTDMANFLAGAQVFGDTASKIVAILEPAIKGFSALSNYVSPAKSSMDKFYDDIHYIVALMAYPLDDWISTRLAGATAFSVTAKAVVDIFAQGLKSMSDLASYSSPSKDALDRFYDDIHYIVTLMAYPLDTWISTRLAGATAFADTVGKIIAVIQPALAAFAALPTMVQVTKGQILDFVANLIELVGIFDREMNDSFKPGGLDGAAGLADASKHIIDIITGAIGAFAVLPGISIIGKGDIITFANNLVELVQIFNDKVQKEFAPGSLDAAAALSDAIAKIMAPIKGAVDAFTAIRTFWQTPKASLQAFFDDLKTTIDQLKVEAAKFDNNSLTILTSFGDAITKNFDGLTKAIDVFTKLQSYGALPAIVFQSFFDSMQIVLDQIVLLAKKDGSSYTKEVVSFVTDLGTLFDTLDKMLTLITGLNNNVIDPGATLQIVFGALSQTIKDMANLNTEAGLFLTGATDFANTMAAGWAQIVAGITAPSSLKAINANISLLPPLTGGSGSGSGTGGKSAARSMAGSSSNQSGGAGGNVYNIEKLIDLSGATFGSGFSRSDAETLLVPLVQDQLYKVTRNNTNIALGYGSKN